MASRLLTTCHEEINPQRRAEMSLAMVINSTVFEEMVVIAEGSFELPEQLNATILRVKRRPTYSEAFQLLNTSCDSDQVNIIANCDILIPEPSLRIIEKNLGTNQAYCLGRYDPLVFNSTAAQDYSQDIWAYRGVVGRALIEASNFFFGVPGCDGRIAHEFHSAGYEVLNPVKSIPNYHLHLSRQRTQTNRLKFRLEGKYLGVTQHFIGERPEYRPQDWKHGQVIPRPAKPARVPTRPVKTKRVKNFPPST